MNTNLGESFLFSYLRRVCQCKICQLNWRNQNEEANNNKSLESDFKKLQDLFKNKGKSLGKLSTLWKQVEIDGIGIGDNQLIFADIAIHFYGLRYKDNAVFVWKKMLRSALLAKYYFNKLSQNRDVKIIFMTPFITPNEKEKIENFLQISALKKIFPLFEFELIIGDKFQEIYERMIENVNISVSDDEFFARGYYFISKIEEHKKNKQQIKRKNENKKSME